MTAKANSRKTLLVQFAIGAVSGAVLASLAAEFGPALDLTGAHLPGLAVAALLALTGCFVLAGSFTRNTAAAVLAIEIEEDDDLRVERNSLRWQGIVTILPGIELMILSFRTDYLTDSRDLLLGLLALGLVAQTWFNLKLWRSGDELFRRIIIEACVIAFLVFQLLLFFWTAGTRFGLAAEPSALDLYVLVLVLYLLASGFAATRRGYCSPA